MPQPPNNPRPTIPSAPGGTTGVPDDQAALLRRIEDRWNRAYGGVHQKWRQRAEHFYGLYRNYTDFKGTLPVDRRDRDVRWQEAKATWGAELFIPYAFSTVETILPRMLQNAPSILVRPRARASEQNVENIKYIIEAQQEQIDYELILQEIARNALITGLGVQKVYWLKKTKNRRVLTPAMPTPENPGGWVVDTQSKIVFDDPMVEAVDPWDFVWDPMADSMRTCSWVIHRTWRDTDYVKQMIQAGYWTGISEQDITVGENGGPKYVEAWQQRMKIAGYPDLKPPDTHEVWEYHDGDQVVTVLNRRWIVQQGANPAWHGEIPFQVYRPTKVQGQMAGIGEIEPIEDLQAEINTLRSQRRDNATVVLQKSFFYADGMIDPADFKIGPGAGVPVLGDPREAVLPIQFGEIPNSGYQEERQLQADIERTTGIDDSLSGAGGTGQTATGVQLVQAAANLRIQMKTRNCEVELVRSGGRQFLALDQQKILENRDVRIPAEPTPEEPDRRWAWLKVGPGELAGEFDIDIEAGSMAPENVPQMRQDAQVMLTLLGNPQIGPMLDPGLATDFVLRNMGIKNTDAWKVQPVQQVPVEVMQRFTQALQTAGVDQRLIGQAQAAATSNNNGSGGNGGQ